MKRIRQTLCLLLALLLLLGVMAPALAASTVITNDDNDYDYFQYHNSEGWHDLNTPYHYDSEGNVAYCIEHRKDPPSSGGTNYTDFDPSTIFSGSTITGIQAILDHGYPVSNGGLSAAEAHYATANALRAWIYESAGQGFNFMDVDRGYIRAKDGAEDVWDLFLTLLDYGRDGDTTGGGTGGEIVVSDINLTWELDGGELMAELTVEAPDGYTIQPSHSAVDIYGYTGGTYDELTITAPLSLGGTDVSLFIQGKGGGSTGRSALLYWYEPGSSSIQGVVSVEVTAGGTPDSGYVHITGGFFDLTVRKTDTYTGSALDGAVFQLTQSGRAIGLYQTGAGQYEAGGNSATFTTSGGTAYITGLPAGNYTLTEVSTPHKGYVGSGSTNVNLTGNGAVNVKNAPTEINVVKTNGLTKAPMPGVTFRLTDGSGNPVLLSKHADGSYRPDSGGSDSFTVDSAGKARILYLPTGQYIIHEPNAEGFAELGSEPFQLTAITNIQAVNEPLALVLTKVDSFTGETLAGVPFSLLDGSGAEVRFSKQADGVYHYDENGTAGFESGADGTAAIYYIPAGSYTLRENEALGLGYAQPKDVPVTITRENGVSSPATVRFQNDPITLEFAKADAVTKEPLDGGTFRLLDESGDVVNLREIQPGSYRPDEDGESTFTTLGGEAVFRYLTPQKYTIEEVSPPTGYTKDTPKSVTVTAENDVSNAAKISMQDYALTLTFDKSDGLTDKPLDGCTFALKDSEGEIVKLKKVKNGVYKPDANGSNTFTTYEGMVSITQIEPGRYTISEETPEAGYTKAADILVTVSETNIATSPASASMKNGVTAISLGKTDALSGSGIGGAVFRLLNEDGETVKLSTITGRPGWMKPDSGGSETFTVPASGLTLAYLPRGAYELVEEKPASGYAEPENGMALTVTDSTTTTAPLAAEYLNEPLVVEVTKTDAHNGEPLPGVNFKVLDAEGKALLFVKTADGEYRVDRNGTALFQTGPEGKAKLIAVPTGDYTLVETENPGFGTVEPVPFTVTNENTNETPVAIGVENQPLALEVYKVDRESQAPLASVPFRLLNGEGEALRFTLGEDGIYRATAEGEEIFRTDDTGKATLLYVPEGILTLEEQPYSGYGVASPVSVTVTEENILTLPRTVTVENEPLAVEIFKEDVFTGQPMSASFTLMDESGKAISLYRMADGSYRPIEHAPDENDQPETEADMEQADETGEEAQSEGSADQPEETNPENDTEEETNGEETEAFEESDAGETDEPEPEGENDASEGEEPEEPAEPIEPGPVEKLTLSAKTGKARIEYLKEGKYQLVEDTIPGYIALSGIEFTLTNEHTKTLPLQFTVSNIPTRFVLSKQDGLTKEPLPGAKFKLTDDGGSAFSLVQQENGTYRPAQEGETGIEILELSDENAQAVICYLPAGNVTVTETAGPVGYSIAPPITTEVGTETVLHTAVQAQKEGATEDPIAETSLAVLDLPLALKVSKVHSKTQKPLAGAGFQLKAETALSTPLRFTVEDGVYWHDPAGSVTTIEAAGDNCEALVYGLPAGKYQLEETVVPVNFFPAPPVSVEITTETTSETPREVVVTNTPQVKLGIDADKFNVVIAMALTVLIGGGIGISAIIRRRKKRQ